MTKNYSNLQLGFLVLLRVSIGWHFLYEGIVKLANPNWTSAGYLVDSKGFMSGFFISMTENPELIKIIDILNMWGLLLIGLGLMLGIFSRIAKFSGIILLITYYLSHPPFIGLDYAIPSEGHYLIVNKTLIEIFALSVLLVFPSSRFIGFDRLVFGKSKIKG